MIKNIYFKDFRIAIDKTSRESVSYKILPFEENERILEQERVTNAFEEIRKAEEERQLALEAEMKAQIEEEKSLVSKFDEGAAKSGRSLAGIFSAALGKKNKNKKKE